MRYSDSFSIKENGIQLPEKGLTSIGIQPQSVCWGVWTEGRNSPQPGTNDQANNYSTIFPQLVVSSIRPHLWQSAFHLGLRLVDAPGALCSAAKLLAELEINCLNVDSASAGYRHAAFEAVAHSLPVTQKISHAVQALDERVGEIAKLQVKNPATAGQLEDEKEHTRRELFQVIGRHMLAGMAGVWCSIRAAEALCFDQARADDQALRDPPVNGHSSWFLYPKIVEYGQSPWFLDPTSVTDANDIPELYRKSVRGAFELLKSRKRNTGTDQEVNTYEAQVAQGFGDDADAWIAASLRGNHQKHAAEAVTCRALLTLAYAWVWRIRYDNVGETVQPLDLYVGDSNNLKCRDGRFSIVQHLGRLRPQSDQRFVEALASFHRTDCFVRFRFRRLKHVARTAKFTVQYTARSDGGATNDAADAQFLGQVDTHGVLAAAIAPLVDCTDGMQPLNLLRVKNVVSESIDDVSENGNIDLIAFSPNGISPELAQQRCLEMSRRVLRLPAIKTAKATQVRQPWIYLSVPPGAANEWRQWVYAQNDNAALRGYFAIHVIERSSDVHLPQIQYAMGIVQLLGAEDEFIAEQERKAANEASDEALFFCDFPTSVCFPEAAAYDALRQLAEAALLIAYTYEPSQAQLAVLDAIQHIEHQVVEPGGDF